jgi:hypothetical protein
VIEPIRKRGLIALLKAMKPLDEDFPEIEDRPQRRMCFEPLHAGHECYF